MPCGAETAANRELPERVEPFLLLVNSRSSCFGLSGPHPGPGVLTPKQGGPLRLLLSREPSSGAGGEASKHATFTPLPEGLGLLILWRLCLSSTGQATRESGLPGSGARSQAPHVTVGGAVDRMVMLCPSSRAPLFARPKGQSEHGEGVAPGSSANCRA